MAAVSVPFRVVVVTVNGAVLLPAATVTLVGTETPPPVVESETRVPPGGATPERVTVP